MMNTKIVVILLILAVVLWRLAVMSNRASRVSQHDSGSGIVASDAGSSGGSGDSGSCHSDSGGGDCGGGDGGGGGGD